MSCTRAVSPREVHRGKEATDLATVRQEVEARHDEAGVEESGPVELECGAEGLEVDLGRALALARGVGLGFGPRAAERFRLGQLPTQTEISAMARGRVRRRTMARQMAMNRLRPAPIWKMMAVPCLGTADRLIPAAMRYLRSG